MPGVGGAYRIDEYEFPAPLASWEDQVIGGGLDGIPFLCSYMRHKWEWPTGTITAEHMEMLASKFSEQCSGGAALTSLETDPPDVSTWDYKYSTVVYDEFVILSITPMTRGLPHYDGVVVEFEVYVNA